MLRTVMSRGSRAETGAVAVVVVPFDDLSGNGERAYFARGFADDIVADLSRFTDLDVIASPGTGPDAAGADVDYVLTGSLRRDGDALRVTAQLASTDDGRVVWAGRYDQAGARLFEVQDDITAQVVAAVSSRISTSLLAAARRKPVTELAAYDTWLRGMDLLKRGSVADDREARGLFTQALEIDPHFSRAHLGLSLTYFNEWSCQLWEAWDENETRAFEHASRAHEIDAEDHYTHLVLGRVLLFRREFERAEAHLDRALALNANDPDALVQLALSFALLGRAPEARDVYERGVRLHPRPPTWYHAYGGCVAVSGERFDDALRELQQAPSDIMVDLPAARAVARLHTGDEAGARADVELFVRQFAERITPGRSPEPGEALRWLAHVNPYRDPRDLARLVDGVKRAGLTGAVRPPALESAPALSAFRKVGSIWQVSYGGADAHLPHAKGLADIARLLSQPGGEMHCTELMGVEAPSAGTPEAIDPEARAAYRRRIADLRAELDEAEARNDFHRAEGARQELETLEEHLAAAFGLGARPRRPGAPEERARSAVTQRIRASIKRIEGALPALGRHLRSSVRTGSFCAYEPEKAPDWRL